MDLTIDRSLYLLFCYFTLAVQNIAEIARLLLNGAIKARSAIRSCVTETSRRSKSRTLIRER